jgi:hypothetical protein
LLQELVTSKRAIVVTHAIARVDRLVYGKRAINTLHDGKRESFIATKKEALPGDWRNRATIT